VSFLLNPHVSFGGFSPSDIPGLVVWFDAQDNATLTVSNVDKCDSWISKEGSLSLSMDSPAGSSNKPIIGDVSGEQMLEFSSARYLTKGVSTSLSPGTGPMSIVTVARTTATARSHLVYMGPSGTAIIQTRINNSVSDGAYVGQFRDNVAGVNRMLWVDTDVDHADGSLYAAVCQRVGGTADGAFYIDNVASSLNPITDNSGTINQNMGNLYFGRTSSGSEPLVGHIGEILIFHHELTTDERADLHTYLAAKWTL
jgi:hypothetical protein